MLSLRERDFVTAAQAMGASRKRIIFKELMPNLWAPVIVVVSLSLPGYLAAEAVFFILRNWDSTTCYYLGNFVR